jgi:dienelactone hydrolase
MPCLDVQVLGADGHSNGTLHLPEGDGPWPGVLVFPDAGGIRETFRSLGDRLAGMGYVVLIPDIYYRAGRPTGTGQRSATSTRLTSGPLTITRPRPPLGGRTRPAAVAPGSRQTASR